MRHILRHGPHRNHILEAEDFSGEFADRNRGAFQAERRNDDIDAAAVRKSRVEHGVRFVDAPADKGCDPLRNVKHMRVMAELQAGQLKFAAPLHIDHVRTVHEDVGHGLVSQQRLDRTEPDHLIDDFAGQRILLGLIERQFPFIRDLGHEIVHERRQLRLAHPHRRDGFDP